MLKCVLFVKVKKHIFIEQLVRNRLIIFGQCRETAVVSQAFLEVAGAVKKNYREPEPTVGEKRYQLLNTVFGDCKLVKYNQITLNNTKLFVQFTFLTI